MGSFIDQEEEIPPRFRSSPTKYGGGRQEKWCMVGQRDFFPSGSDCLYAGWRNMCASNGFIIYSRGEKNIAARWRLTATRDFLAFNLLTWFYSAK